MSLTLETTFETAIIESFLESGGYTQGDAKNYSKDNLFLPDIINLICWTLTLIS